MTLETYCIKYKNSKLLDEWAEENREFKPSMVLVTSKAMVWWKCSCGHTWRDTVENRISGTECKYCNTDVEMKVRVDLRIAITNFL
ncbi:MAG: zinc-ribbon domain-containing protein [Eubacteriales bacterium]